MKHVTFSLPSETDRQEFQRATTLLRKSVAAGWTLVNVGVGYSGGLSAGRFEIRAGSENETLTFRLSDAAMAGYRDALRDVEVGAAGDEVVLDVETDGGGRRGVFVVGLPVRKRSARVKATSSARQMVRKGIQMAAAQRASIYDLTEAAALQGLREGKGAEADQVRALMGDDYFRLLSEMARQVRPGGATRGKGLGKVLVLPGIMGSKLGRTKSLLGLANYNDVIWLDPVDMRLGRLADLALRQGGRPQKGTQSVGVLYSFYLRLKLALDLGGFDADFHHYDWRRPVRDLGAEFAAFLNRQDEPVTIVAHSMGGIVTRAAIHAGVRDEKIRRVIMIGTPNHGSYVPAQALRAAYPFLKTLALTFDRDLSTVTDEVFSTFAGLYDLLPAASKFPDYPIFDPAHWPKSKPRPNAEYLESAKSAQSILAPADERFHLICGINQDTVVGMKLEGDEFVFLQNKDGDGTVPRESALLPGCPTLYVEGSHGMLPNYGIVCDLAVDLARDGRTDRKTVDWVRPTGPLEEVRESALRTMADMAGVTRGAEPSPMAMRAMLSPLMALAPLGEVEAGAGGSTGAGGGASGSEDSAGAPGGGARPGTGVLFTHALKGIVVGRHRQRQLEVALFPGSLTAVPSRAYLLGLFQGVVPAGAALAVDQLMGDAVSDFVQRRMLSGRLGEVFIVPKGRSFVLADHVIFVGLGPFDRFRASSAEGGEDTMRLVCESVVRTCLHANVEEFATILLGGSAAPTTREAIRTFTRSFLDALKVADPQRRIRKVTLCENDPQRVIEIRTELLQLATTDMFEDVELELRDLPAPAAAAQPVVRGTGKPSGMNPIYLLTRMFDPTKSGGGTLAPSSKSSGPDELVMETSLLLPRSKGAILTAQRPVPLSAKNALLGKIGQGGFSRAVLEEIGRDLVSFAFDEPMRAALSELAKNHRQRPLVVVHDPVASQLPWEAFRFEDWRPAIEGGITRQHLDANLSVAKWLEERVVQPVLDVLLVTNPTEDLDGAEREGEMIRNLLGNVPNVSLTERRGSQATRAQLLTDFRSGRFDVVHYAGHAFFAPDHPGRSGLICAENQVLSGVDVASLSNLPALIFFNACESGRIRGRGPAEKTSGTKGKVFGAKPAVTRKADTMENLSVAAALIRGGVANFLGTYWPVGDLAAESFGRTFYPLLVAGHSIGESVLAARKVVEKQASADWADYILYGNPDFVLKRSA